jgi:hypothetical protein
MKDLCSARWIYGVKKQCMIFDSVLPMGIAKGLFRLLLPSCTAHFKNGAAIEDYETQSLI